MERTVAEQNAGIWSGILLLAGTCIGAGMLALPVVTGVAGFLPALLVNTLCWLFMLATGLLFLEATLWMEKNCNLLSMAEHLLGKWGKWIGGLSFLFLYYCLQVSYMAGGAPLLGSALNLPYSLSVFLFAALFGTLAYLGTRVVDRLNWLLMIGMGLSYLLLIGLGSQSISAAFLSKKQWGLCLLAAPTLFSAYGYHNIIPTLATYMRQNAWQLRTTIIVGTSIPFLVYSLWQWIIIGTVPEGALVEAANQGVPISQTLQNFTGNAWISTLGVFFGFFALVTSLLGVSLSMIDFLADGFKTRNRLSMSFLVFAPSALLAATNPGIFLEAIGYAGGFGEAILNGLFPIAMVWVGRYKLLLKGERQLPGGRLMLSFLALITLFIIALEVKHILG